MSARKFQLSKFLKYIYIRNVYIQTACWRIYRPCRSSQVNIFIIFFFVTHFLIISIETFYGYLICFIKPLVKFLQKKNSEKNLQLNVFKTDSYKQRFIKKTFVVLFKNANKSFFFFSFHVFTFLLHSDKLNRQHFCRKNIRK